MLPKLNIFKIPVRKTLQENRPLHILLNLMIILSALFVAHMILFKYLENTPWFESFWQTWQTFTTVGYGNRPAVTNYGRLTSVLFATLGIAILGAVFSAAIEVKNHYQERKRLGSMKNPYKNAYIIINFPGERQSLRIINELRTTEKNIAFCFVDESLLSLPESISKLSNIHFVSGNTLEKNTYKEANVLNNKTIIIYPKDDMSPSSDGTSKILVDLVSTFKAEETRILYVLVDPKNQWMFPKHAVSILKNFWILALVQECQDPFTSIIAESLLSNTKSEIPITVKPKEIIGLSWEKFIINCAKYDAQINPLALIRHNSITLCPPKNTIIKKNDLISIIANKNLNWKKLEKKLASQN
jgi:voltage-gated potassium channel